MDLDDNPYAPPTTSTRAPVGIRGNDPKAVRAVAVYQKGIIVAMLVYLGCGGLTFGLNAASIALPSFYPGVILTVLAIDVLVGIVFVFLLSMKVYHPVLGVFLAIFTAIPFLGLLILLMVSGKATATLRANGCPVGFLGANLNKIPK